MRSKKLIHRQVLIGLSFICLSLIQAKSAISVPTATEYEQFRGGVYFPDCDDYFDIPKFIAVQREGGLTGLIRQVRFDGEEAKSLVLAVNSGCTYYRTKSGKIHKVATFRSGSSFYDGKPIKKILSSPNPKDFVFLDSKSVKHTIEHLDQERSQSVSRIPNGRYVGESPSDAVIEIKNNQYCGANFVTDKMECHPISDLKYIKPGVVQLGNEENGYFCSEKLFKINSSGECTANGWVKR
jgi:hypothetical protein